MTKQRPCDACEGTGENYRSAFDRDGCPACSGRGWQSDAMPVSDALADSECYTRNAGIGFNPDAGERAASLLRQLDEKRGDAVTLAACAEDEAFFSARAAFRAVPGLRG